MLTSECSLDEEDYCKRRSKVGLLLIKRPISIKEYNKYMGGVDIADQKRLFWESRIHKLSRWWIRVFFYYVDVGTVNAMVLYRKSIASTTNINLRDFKMSWVNSYCGERIRRVTKPVLGDLPTCHLV